MADKRKRGLAVMAPEKRREIARLGGQTTQRLGKGHTFTLEETQRGGKKGGRTVSRNRAHMAEIGLRGAISPAGNEQRRKTGTVRSRKICPFPSDRDTTSDKGQSRCRKTKRGQ